MANKIKKMEENIAVRLALGVRLDQPMANGKTFREGHCAGENERDWPTGTPVHCLYKFTGPILSQFGKGVDDVVARSARSQTGIGD